MPPPTVEELQEQLQTTLQQMQGQTGATATRIDAYRIPKIPPFLIKDPVIWFIQVEAPFETARIIDQKTKAHHVIMSLDAEAIACCRDLIAEPDDTVPYTKLKQHYRKFFCFRRKSTSAIDQGAGFNLGKTVADSQSLAQLKCGQTLRRRCRQDNLLRTSHAIYARHSCNLRLY